MNKLDAHDDSVHAVHAACAHCGLPVPSAEARAHTLSPSRCADSC